jgi:hypothetical protein
MPAQSSITLNDAAATPVAHVFTPNGALARPDGKVIAEWVDSSPGQKVGYWSLTEQYSPTNGNGIEKFRWVLQIPTLETLSNNTATGITPAPTKAFDGTVVIEVWMSERAVAQELAYYAKLMKELASSTFLKDSIENRSRPW